MKSSLEIACKDCVEDYSIAYRSRQASLLGRKEVFGGNAKFGIFGDGKELPQVALAKVFKKGDWRSGYYRDQTLMMALGVLTVKDFFSQLYAHTNISNDPASGGRMMVCHFGTRIVDDNGNFRDLTKSYNSSSDISPNAAQMPRLLGLGYASKLFRDNKSLSKYDTLSKNGDEIAFGTIGNAATSEGMFYETINAAGVLQVPLIISVWDDDYGISVPNEYHTTKSSISEVLKGFQRTSKAKGIEILKVKGWDYHGLIETYLKAEKLSRAEHVPVLVHVTELTQPQGHSTSGSHERYKSKERLRWESDNDCLTRMRQWIIDSGVHTDKQLQSLEQRIDKEVLNDKNKAWREYRDDIGKLRSDLLGVINKLSGISEEAYIKRSINRISQWENCSKSDIIIEAKKMLSSLKDEYSMNIQPLAVYINDLERRFEREYNSGVYSDDQNSALRVKTIYPNYNDSPEKKQGFEIINSFFDSKIQQEPRLFFIGEDVGKLGDVNQGLAGLQKKYGENRVTDTGIRECTIIGQGIGAALRGLRPIVEVQYLDYLPYALQILSDDLSCLRYRTAGGQQAPLIIRTRGHRLEGIWHSGSYMSSIINAVRGIYVIVPRNFVQAAGFYNTMLESNDPAIIIERLNGYRIKENLPSNLANIRIPVGVPEVIREGDDVTIVTYGAMCDIVLEAAQALENESIYCEVIDARTLLPFDRNKIIVESLKKTNKIIFADEDVPGGATSYMMKVVLEDHDGFHYLEAKPRTVTSKEHRPPYGDDGDYFSKPNKETIYDTVLEIMKEANPRNFFQSFIIP